MPATADPVAAPDSDGCETVFGFEGRVAEGADRQQDGTGYPVGSQRPHLERPSDPPPGLGGATEPVGLSDWSEIADVPIHPDADKFTCPKWDEPGECICGAALPPQKDWTDAGHQWQRIACSACGRGYVDEDDFIAFYDAAYVAAQIREDGAW